MKIANPIYDIVFKYLLDDKKIAKLIISKILDEEIESLEFRPTELNKKINTNLTVFRIDFAATIKRPDGSRKLVLIEIQKAKLHTDIMRFRKYLGTHYQDKNNVYYDEDTHETRPLPIISLYFIGHKLNYTDAPVIKVNRQYIDLATQTELKVKEEFIESLTHDSYIIQIPYLRARRRNKLEILLSIFDQSLKLSGSDHFLDLEEEKYPKEFQVIIRRLLKAAAEKDVCETMDLEDDILDELESMERKILDKEQALADNAKALVEKDKALAEKDKALADNAKALAENAKALADKEQSIKKALDALTKSGLSIDAARKMLGI